MPNDVFEISRDLSIRYYNPTTGAYTQIVADSVEVEIDQGIDIEQSVFAKGSIGTATIKLVKKNLSDFLGTPGYQAGYGLEIDYRPFPDSNPGIWNRLFTGVMQNISMGYINESKILQIEITANDFMRKFQNTIVGSYSVTGTVTQRSYRNCMINLFNAVGVSFNAGGAGASATTQRSFTWLNTPAGEIAEQFLDAELGWVYPLKTGAISYLTRTDVATKQAISYVNGNPTISNVHYTNLITNGNFQVNLTGWDAGPDLTQTRDTTIFYNDVASMKEVYSGPFDNYYGATNTVMTVTPGSKYKASFQGRGGPVTGKASVRIEWQTSAGVFISNDESPQIATTNTGWTEIAVTAVAPVGAGRAKVFWRGFTIGTGGKTLYIDNFKLENLTNISTGHYCLDNIVLKYDSDDLVNKAVVIDKTSLIRTTASNTASIASYGEQAGKFTVDFDSAAGPTTFANLASEIVNSSTIKEVQQVTVPVIRDDGRASDIADREVGSTIQVEFAQEPLAPLQVVSIISRINHIITPQHWEMNIGLWRGI
jgi:hypothetical protein